MKRIGKGIVSTELDFTWEIKDFLSLSKKIDKYYSSPTFSFAGESWYLDIYPNGKTAFNSVGYIDIYLCRESNGPPVTVEYYFSLESSDGKKCHIEEPIIYTFEERNVYYGCCCYLKRSQLLERKRELMSSDALIIVCSMKYSEGSTDDRGTTATPETTSVPPEEKLAVNKSKKCPKCFDAIDSEKWYNHKCLIIRAEAIEKLLQNLKKLMLNGDYSDTIIRVKREEFRLHKCILSIRNPYFDLMFKKEMRQHSDDIIHITDCEADQFRALIHYTYTGTVEKLTPESALSLYEIAEIYQEEQLKIECLQLMMNSICVENFCDIITFALKHDERKLYEASTEFFPSRAKEITRIEKWRSFVKKYPEQVDELYKKILDENDNRCHAVYNLFSLDY